MPEYLDSTYDLAANTYTAKEQSFAVVEVGDAKRPEVFSPQVKIMRWDNECNFSARLVHEEASPKVALVADKVQWIGDAVEAHFYEIGEGKEGGGYEFEIILKKAPKSNVISMTLQTKGLDFFYQAELTPEEVAGGAIRPENVVGSYAVYHKTMAGDYTALGGKNYLAGKAFHIFRPRIEDATGAWCWGDLNIDEAAGLLTVTIPQDFLDKATYPVRHAAGLEFGYHTAGASDNWFGSYAELAEATSTPASDGSLTKMTVYCRSDKVSDLTVALYSKTSNAPNVRLAQTTPGTSMATDMTFRWVDVSISYGSIVAGTHYYLGIGDSAGRSKNLAYDSGSPSEWEVYDSYNFPVSAGGHSNGPWGHKISIYATYTAAGGSVKVPRWLFNQAALGQGVG